MHAYWTVEHALGLSYRYAKIMRTGMHWYWGTVEHDIWSVLQVCRNKNEHWLALILRDSWTGHLACLVIGVQLEIIMSTGMHEYWGTFQLKWIWSIDLTLQVCKNNYLIARCGLIQIGMHEYQRTVEHGIWPILQVYRSNNKETFRLCWHQRMFLLCWNLLLGALQLLKRTTTAECEMLFQHQVTKMAVLITADRFGHSYKE